MQQKVSIEFAHNLFQSYRIRCNSFCHEMQIPPTAFDILMFLANNPAYSQGYRGAAGTQGKSGIR